jgi:hypothetical protein
MCPQVVLIDKEGAACGVLEDTRRGKRLFMECGGEMVSAHVSAFAYRTPAAGARILRAATARAGIPVFAAVPGGELPRLMPMLEGLEVGVSLASVYGHGFEAGRRWWIDSAEI